MTRALLTGVMLREKVGHLLRSRSSRLRFGSGAPRNLLQPRTRTIQNPCDSPCRAVSQCPGHGTRISEEQVLLASNGETDVLRG